VTACLAEALLRHAVHLQGQEHPERPQAAAILEADAGITTSIPAIAGEIALTDAPDHHQVTHFRAAWSDPQPSLCKFADLFRPSLCKFARLSLSGAQDRMEGALAGCWPGVRAAWTRGSF
ncbi:hypothetical protein, partial [Mesorhizobium sp. M7A.T.Ca.US.000.02.2.1]|uniref:hypothetical protein n=1 Tax=Mesorhizobium sp. M7A.T.Ca.US.000.02.2.1 TaxID=2496793 RepID=UPI001AECB774